MNTPAPGLSDWERIKTGGNGGSSIGRVAVSKTVGWGFDSLPPCQSAKSGEVAEWSIAAVLKTASGESLTGVRIPPSPPAGIV